MKTPNFGSAAISSTIVIISLIVINETQAQSRDFPPLENSRLGIEIMKPNLERFDEVKSLSSIWFVSFQKPFGTGNWAFTAEIPFSIYDQDDFQFAGTTFPYDGQFLIGNPLIAVEYRSTAAGLGGYGWFGVRPPLADEDKEDAIVYGWITDLDRQDAFFPKQLSLLGGGGWRGELSQSELSSFQLHIGISGSGLLATDDNYDSELFARGHLQIWYITPQFAGHVGYSAVAWVTSDDLDFSELMESQLTIGMRVNLGNVSPGAFIRLPVEEDLSRIVSFVGGVNLLINFPRTQ